MEILLLAALIFLKRITLVSCARAHWAQGYWDQIRDVWRNRSVDRSDS